MTDQDRQCCASGHACTRPAIAAVSIRPTRADLPYCACHKLSQFWPTYVMTITMRACQPHVPQVTALGSVYGQTSLGDEVAVRTVKADEEAGP